MDDNSLWMKIEKYTNENFPPCLKIILTNCGYDTQISLQNITLADVLEIEKYTNQHLKPDVMKLNCCYSEQYKAQQDFQFLPGHRKLILYLPKIISNFPEPHHVSTLQRINFPSTMSFLLKLLFKTCENNSNKQPNQYRYTAAIHYVSVYAYMLGGKLLYEFLRENLHLPSTSTVNCFIAQNSDKIVEGEVRVKQLSDYLDKMKAPRSVWLSEDATGIIPKIEYDQSTNQVTGLVLPINSSTDTPIFIHRGIQRRY